MLDKANALFFVGPATSVRSDIILSFVAVYYSRSFIILFSFPTLSIWMKIMIFHEGIYACAIQEVPVCHTKCVTVSGVSVHFPELIGIFRFGITIIPFLSYNGTLTELRVVQ